MNVEFSIEATGINLQFRWQKDDSDLMNGGKYRGIYTDTLRIEAVEGSDEGDYRCLVENDVGRLFSDEALLSFGKLLAFATCICSQILQLFVGSNQVCHLQECRHFQHNHELSLRATHQFIGPWAVHTCDAQIY